MRTVLALGLFVKCSWMIGSAASVAGLTKLAAAGSLEHDAVVVAVLTGAGLKDPDTAEKSVAGRIVESDATEAGVKRALGW